MNRTILPFLILWAAAAPASAQYDRDGPYVP